jgi:hypothetical protein
MFFDRWYYELKLMGKRVIITPLVIVLGFILLAFFLQTHNVDPARTLLACAEMIFPIASGVIVGTIATNDPALELQLTVIRKYHRTGMMRLLFVLLWSALIAMLWTNAIAALHMVLLPNYMKDWSPIATWGIIQLFWSAPLLACTALGLCLALLLQNRVAGVSVLAGIWIAEIVLKDFIALTDWLQPFQLFPVTLLAYPPTNVPANLYSKYIINTRYDIIGMALVLFILGWLLLRNPERMLKGATAE